MVSSREPASAFVGAAGIGEIKALRKDNMKTCCVLKDRNTFPDLFPVSRSLAHY